MATAALSEHRKIDLQSPADLAYIRGQMSRAARANIDRALPPAAAPAGEDDALRRAVERLVDAYVTDVWRGVRQNARVNGIDVVEGGEQEDGEVDRESAGDDLEPFDQRLADRIRALEAQKESLTEQVADLRRTAPRRAAANFETQFLAETARLDGEAAAAREEEVARAGVADGPIISADTGVVARWDDVRRTWERGTEGLVELKTGLGETRAKAERARRVVEYVEGRG